MNRQHRCAVFPLNWPAPHLHIGRVDVFRRLIRVTYKLLRRLVRPEQTTINSFLLPGLKFWPWTRVRPWRVYKRVRFELLTETDGLIRLHRWNPHGTVMLGERLWSILMERLLENDWPSGQVLEGRCNLVIRNLSNTWLKIGIVQNQELKLLKPLVGDSRAVHFDNVRFCGCSWIVMFLEMKWHLVFANLHHSLGEPSGRVDLIYNNVH